MRATIVLAVLALVGAACTSGSGGTVTSTTPPEPTTTSTAPPAAPGTSTAAAEPPVTSTTQALEGFCPTVEAALAEVDEVQKENPDMELEDMWALLQRFYRRLQPVAPTELQDDLEVILADAALAEARARDPEGVPSPPEEEYDVFHAAIATVMAYIETECNIPTIEAVPLG